MNAVAVPVGRGNRGSHRAPRTGQLLADPGASSPLAIRSLADLGGSAPPTASLLADLGGSAPQRLRQLAQLGNDSPDGSRRLAELRWGAPPPVRCSPTAPTARQNTVARWPHGPAASPMVRRRADTQVLARRIGRTRATPVLVGCRPRCSTAPPGTGARRSWSDPAPTPDGYLALASPGSPRPPCNAPRSVRRSPTPVDSTPRRSAPRPASADRDSSHSPFRWSIS
jgi:hypothetical protein